MKNPLNKRILREFRDDFGKYAVIFLFMVMLISLVSAFLVADNSVYHAYEEGFTKYHLEWGHFTLSGKLPEDVRSELSQKGDVDLYDLNYFEEKEKNGAMIRVYELRNDVNLECVMSGELPQTKEEIALDRMYAKNAGYEIGDTVLLNGKEKTVSGLIAVPDYSCLFENNTDMMFDSIHFSIAVMTKEGYEDVGSKNQFYNYAWMYQRTPSNEKEEKEQSDDFLEVFKDILIEKNQQLLMEQGESTEMLTLDNYIPRYSNQAINFTGEDMGSDKAMFLLFDYIVIVILAFVFAVTISNTIVQEAGVIGTLRASGYTKGELVRHYMVLPVAVTLIAALAGNIFGYTFLKNYMVGVYYNSYSLCTYETLWNAEAFLDTTVVPVILMFLINMGVLTYKMRLSPLDFLRRDLTGKQKLMKKKRRMEEKERTEEKELMEKKKPIEEKKKSSLQDSGTGRSRGGMETVLWRERTFLKIPFLHRFRLRIIAQNIANYVTLFVGILFAAIILIFGLMFKPLLEDYADMVSDSMLAKYQYVLKTPVDTETEQAEKYCLTELESTYKNYLTDKISIYGIEKDSSYVKKDIPAGKVLVSEGILKKFGLEKGDTVTLGESYSDKTYDFLIDGEYTYDAGLAVFMAREDYLERFGKEDDFFTGYFSDEELSDVDPDDVAAVVTKDDLTKVSNQLLVSMGDFMVLFRYFGVLMFVLLMYLLTKQIIEKNAASISILKILGFTDGEIGGLYIAANSVVVVVSLLAAVPITDGILREMFHSYIYTEMTGYVPYIVSDRCFVTMVFLGIAAYAAVAVLQFYKIKRIPQGDVLRGVE
jgi:putative ABC transport system permease protein